MNTLSVKLKKPITFATFDSKIKRGHEPDFCPLCYNPTIKGIHYCECSDIECEYSVEIFDPEEKPTRYDWEAGVIIE